MKAPLQRRQDWIRGRRVKRKLARQARVRRQVLRYTMLFALVIAGVCGFTQLPWAISSTDRDIYIHGNQVVSNEQVRAVLKSAVGKPVYGLDPQLLEEKVCSLPAVKYAFVRRYIFPRPELRVEVLEEFPWASYSSTPEGPIEGVVAQTGRIIPLSQFPNVVQPDLRLCVKSDCKLNPASIAKWDGWVRLLAAQTGQPVKMIDMRNPTAIVAISGVMELHVGAADSTLTRRLGRLASVMPVADKLQDKLKYVDLSLDSNIPLKVDSSASSQHEDLLKERPASAPDAASVPGAAAAADTGAVATTAPESPAAAAVTAPAAANPQTASQPQAQ